MHREMNLDEVIDSSIQKNFYAYLEVGRPSDQSNRRNSRRRNKKKRKSWSGCDRAQKLIHYKR